MRVSGGGGWCVVGRHRRASSSWWLRGCDAQPHAHAHNAGKTHRRARVRSRLLPAARSWARWALAPGTRFVPEHPNDKEIFVDGLGGDKTYKNLKKARRDIEAADLDIALYAITKKTGSVFRLGIYLDFVRRSGTTHAEGHMWALNTCGEPNELELTATLG